MKLSLNFDKLLVEALLEDLQWFEDEIDEQFINKKTYTYEDVDHANQILNAMKERMSVIKNEAVKRSLTKVYEAHKSGSVQEANTINPNNFSIYLK